MHQSGYITPPPHLDDHSLLVAEYEFARDNRSSADATAWEMTAIVWGAQTLLLGFVLEALSNRDVQVLIIFLGVLGIAMSGFNFVVMRARNKVCKAMVKICSAIEDEPGIEFKPQHQIDIVYKPKRQTWAFGIVNALFVPMWLWVIYKAGCLYFHPSLPTGIPMIWR
jgi:hypothetical protein